MSIFEDLIIHRASLHQVKKMAIGGSPQMPNGGDMLEATDKEKTELISRVTEALGVNSHNVAMEVERSESESVFGLCSKILDVNNDAEFLQYSNRIANALATSQTHHTIQDCDLLVLSGSTSHLKHPYVGIIKAQSQSGFIRTKTSTGRLSLSYNKDVLLTKDQDFFKMAFFVDTDSNVTRSSKLPNEFAIHVYDKDLSPTGARQYFGTTFLGCRTIATNPTINHEFYSKTRDFLNTAAISQEKLHDLMNALEAYMFANQENVIGVHNFAVNFLPRELRDDYEVYMFGKNIPVASFVKDVSVLRERVKRRAIRFNSGVNLSAPADCFSSLVEVGSFEDGKTILTIKGQVKTEK